MRRGLGTTARSAESMDAKPEIKAECIRLRVEERLSLRDIHSRTCASKSSLSSWLKPYPLTAEEKKPRMQAPPLTQRYMPPPEAELSRTVRSNGLNNLQVAKVSEAAILLRLLAQGFNPFGSTFDGDRSDWLVEVPSSGRVWKIQVK